MSPTSNYGLMAFFPNPAALYHAAEKVRDAGYHQWDCFTPFPVHGLDGAMGVKRSRVPVFTFIGGFIGFFTGMFIAWFMGAYDYPLIVNGMPFFSPVFPFPVAYELMILLAAFGTLIGMFALNRLPMHYHPTMNVDAFAHVTDDRFALVIESTDQRFDDTQTEAFLAELGGQEITRIPA